MNIESSISPVEQIEPINGTHNNSSSGRRFETQQKPPKDPNAFKKIFQEKQDDRLK